MVEVLLDILSRALCFHTNADNNSAAVTPDEAADSLIKFVEKFDIKSTGEYWAPRGPRYVISALYHVGFFAVYD